MFRGAQYEDQIVGNSVWATGDWNCDGEFGTQDLVAAFQEGAYNSAAIAVRLHSVSAVFDDRPRPAVSGSGASDAQRRIAPAMLHQKIYFTETSVDRLFEEFGTLRCQTLAPPWQEQLTDLADANIT